MEKRSSHDGGLWTEDKEGNERLEIRVRSELRVLQTRGRTKDIES